MHLHLHCLLIVSAFVIAFCLTDLSIPLEPCDFRFRCSDFLDVSWATNGTNCLVFRNSCYMRLENCTRQDNNQTLLQEVDKLECQELCPDVCTTLCKPVCAVFDGYFKTFSNACLMDQYICQEGIPFILYSNSSCISYY